MESTNPTVLNFNINKLSFWVQNDKNEQLKLTFDKKISCNLGKAKQKNRLFISIEVSAKSVPEGAFEFSAQCSAVVASIAQDISDDELKDQIERVYVPLVDQMVVEKIKKITIEMGQAPLDLTTNELENASK